MRMALDLAAGIPWLITQDGLDQILAIAAREQADMAAVERAIAAYENSPEMLAMRNAPRLEGASRATLRDGVAIVPVVGPIFRYANLMTAISGATSTQMLAQDFQTALDSPEARAIVLAIDSPGGQASGIAELAGAIRAGTNRKPVVAYAGDMAASGAYWLATAASQIVLSPTGMVGSIGAVMAGADTATRDAVQGVRRYAIASRLSPRKALDPASRDGEAEIQAVVDALAERFVAAVAENRGVSVDTVLSDFGQGGLIPRPEQAVAVGMADRIGTFETVLRELAAAGSPRLVFNGFAAAAADRGATMSEANKPAAMTAAELVTAYPEAVGQIRAAAIAEAAPALRVEGREAAIQGERQRIAQIMKRTLPGHSELRDRAIESGLAYADFLEAQTASEQERGVRRLDALRNDEKTQPRVDAAPNAGSAAASADVPADAPIDVRAKAEWDKSAGLRGEFGGEYSAFLAYRQAEAAGQVRRYIKEG
jgi:signal peptide peptidase SppA